MKHLFRQTEIDTRNLVVINLSGDISYSNRSVKELIETFSFDDDEEKDFAIIVNSHGGSLACAQTITSYINRWKDRGVGKIYGVVEDIALSAAYYILLVCDSIYAEDASIVGGVGAVVKIDDYTALYGKLGVSVNTYKSGSYKDIMNVKRSLDTHEEEMIGIIVQESHQQFLQKLFQYRPALESTPTVQEGMWYTGKSAKATGLIDETTGYLGLVSMLEAKLNSQNKRLRIEQIESCSQTSEPSTLLSRILQKLGLNTSLSDMLVK